MGLELKNISKSWRGFSLKNINLVVEDDDYFILLGPTGSGKTLLLETIMGFHRPDHGRIFLNGVDITDTTPEKRNIGYVSQKCVLFPHMNVRQNIAFGLKMRGTPKTEQIHVVDQILELAGLKQIQSRKPANLSGGEKQKVALARVLATKPKTILFDEPLTAIDVEASQELKAELKRISGLGKTIIHVTHDQVEGFSLGNKMAVMKSGELVQVGKPKEIFTKPRTEFVAKFLGYENIFKTSLVKKQDLFYVVTAEGVNLKVSKPVDSYECVVAIRPEDITVHFSAVNDDGFNVLKGTVSEFVDQGPTVLLIVDAGLRFCALMTKRVFVEKNLEVGQTVWLSFNADSVKII
ncbi:MAG: ABC transporter ATP-binding protein [Candidatus Bathyarchaeota archaeon]|nr:ABC transporter ATP-binding protein [Candidatus Bathyarchaeota archaeon]